MVVVSGYCKKIVDVGLDSVIVKKWYVIEYVGLLPTIPPIARSNQVGLLNATPSESPQGIYYPPNFTQTTPLLHKLNSNLSTTKVELTEYQLIECRL